MTRTERILSLSGWAVAAAIVLAAQAKPVPDRGSGVLRGTGIEIVDDDENVIFWVGATEDGTVARLMGNDPSTGVAMNVNDRMSQIALYGDGAMPVVRLDTARHRRGLVSVHDLDTKSFGLLGVTSAGAMCEIFAPDGMRAIQIASATPWGHPAVTVMQGDAAVAIGPEGPKRKPKPVQDN